MTVWAEAVWTNKDLKPFNILGVFQVLSAKPYVTKLAQCNAIIIRPTGK